MKIGSMLRVLGMVALPAALALSVGGCPPVTTPGVLTGSWNVSTVPEIVTPNLVRITLGFDDNDELTVIKVLFVNATFVSQSPNDFTATTTVSGSTVTIAGDTGDLTIQFTGTLNSAGTVITGTGSAVLETDRGTITIPAGTQIILTKSPA